MRTTVSGLATYVWIPPSPRAVLVMRTPYGAASHAAEAAGWMSRGIGFVAQDVRGRHESPGTFHPYAEDLCDDGPALLAWVRSRSVAPVVLLGTSYGAHAALATACVDQPDGVVMMVPALGLGGTARTRGGVLQLASRLGWWLANDVRRPWADVISARRRDAERAVAVGALTCPLLTIGGTDDYFAHDTIDLWSTWGGPSYLTIGPWAHDLAGATRARRILTWLDAMLAGAPAGIETIDRTGRTRDTPPAMAVVHVDAGPNDQWCASLTANGREIAHGAARGTLVTLGPAVLDESESSSLELRLGTDDFPRYAASLRPGTPVPRHHLELTS
jgi:predicted acyl esterase